VIVCAKTVDQFSCGLACIVKVKLFGKRIQSYVCGLRQISATTDCVRVCVCVCVCVCVHYFILRTATL
jgi:hypothetical protein